MSEIATYTFLPWLRQGLANQIGGASGHRATVPVELVLSGEKVEGGTETRPPIQKTIEIYGPGDITGLDQRTIIRTEPRGWITNFEPNFLAHIEFYDEDLPWRYTPLTPNGHRLLPWIALVVLGESEFQDGRNVKDRPLPYLRSNAETKLAPPEQLWAWAHVHVNRNLIGSSFVSTHPGAVQSQLRIVLDADADMGYSRILCPRKLDPNTSYHAFLVPTFESGRLAGLGEDPTGAAAPGATAWTTGVVPQEIPYYHRWHFRTGDVGDFEYLVRLLEPQLIDSRVGLRDLDVRAPGANIRGIVDPPDATPDQTLGGILKLGGALQIPDIFYTADEFKVVQRYRHWATLNETRPYPHPFQQDVAAFINLTDDYEEVAASVANAESGIDEVRVADDPETEYDIGRNPDPLITAPLYGRWHALTKRLLQDRAGDPVAPNDNWVHELNLDPRWRSAAGFGTAVVQDNQEDYMQAAWDQVGDILESNQKIRFAQLAKEASISWYVTHLEPYRQREPDRWLAISAPLHARVVTRLPSGTGAPLGGRATVRHLIGTSRVPRAALSTGSRKVLRPRGPLAKRLPFDQSVTPSNLVSRLNEGEVSAAPPRESPESLDGFEGLDAVVPRPGIPGFLADLLEASPWVRWLLLLLALLILVLLLLFDAGALAWALGVAIVAGLLAAFVAFTRWARRIAAAGSIALKEQTPESVDSWPPHPRFRLAVAGAPPVPVPLFAFGDNEEARRFKVATRDAYALIQTHLAASVHVPRPRLDLAGTVGTVFEALDPATTIPRWVWGSVSIPARIKDGLRESFVPAMAYPEIDLPMYRPLADRSSELFLPNIDKIAQNSISLLETNQAFIEAYMVGLNHEFARELLWREFPTDQRGSYFRQFWEPRGFLDGEGLDQEALKEKLRDIPPIHLWSKFSELGDHDHREVGGDNEEEVVLVIRGELLKKYPNAVIYAHQAVWRDKNGDVILEPSTGAPIDPSKERDLRPLPESEQENPPRNVVKTPLYEAKVDPDIYFFGFDLTVCEAKGGTGTESEPVDERCADEGITWDDPGWFFVIKERPGEPRFGLDESAESNLDSLNRVEVWNDLGWQDVTPSVPDGGFLQITAETVTLTSDQPLEPDDPEKETQQDEDEHLMWHKDMSSAELAYILYQVPVLVAVHAAEMLPDHPPTTGS